jgi:hypothetical protein
LNVKKRRATWFRQIDLGLGVFLKTWDIFCLSTIVSTHSSFVCISTEIWDALRAAAEADTHLAQLIVDSAGVIVTSEDLSTCYDERGTEFISELKFSKVCAAMLLIDILA